MVNFLKYMGAGGGSKSFTMNMKSGKLGRNFVPSYRLDESHTSTYIKYAKCNFHKTKIYKKAKMLKLEM